VIAFKAILEVHGKILIENIDCSTVNSFICLQKFFQCLKINWHLYKTMRRFFIKASFVDHAMVLTYIQQPIVLLFHILTKR